MAVAEQLLCRQSGRNIRHLVSDLQCRIYHPRSVRTIADKLRIQFAGQCHIGQRPCGDQDQLPRVLSGGLYHLDHARACAAGQLLVWGQLSTVHCQRRLHAGAAHEMTATLCRQARNCVAMPLILREHLRTANDRTERQLCGIAARAFFRLQCDAVCCWLHVRNIAKPITSVELQQCEGRSD